MSTHSFVTQAQELFGSELLGVWSSPGRVNIIGEHTDYNQGFVFPCAIDFRTYCAVSTRTDSQVVATSTGQPDAVSLDLREVENAQFEGWGGYVLGVIWALNQQGYDVKDRDGLNLAIHSDVPVGAGLSSSAALESAVVTALNDVWELGLSLMERAKIGQLAENGAVGAPTGIMDQVASLCGVVDHAVLLDCDSLHYDAVALHFEENGLSLLVVDSQVSHSHATGGYASRRQACERVATTLGKRSLRDVSQTELEQARAVLADEDFRRARHVITENDRVLELVRLLGESGPRAIGDAMYRSHLSMRDDFEISVPEIDLIVETAMRNGAVGARLTGGGFGGCAIALVDTAQVEAIGDAIAEKFAAAGYAPPRTWAITPANGAGRDR